MCLFGLAACGGGGGGGGGSDSDSAPAFGSLSFATKQDTQLSSQVTATGGRSALTFARSSEPRNGTLVSFATSGAFVYSPNAGFLGDDSFGVQVSDSGGHTTSGTVTINVHPNRVPAAARDVVRADTTSLASINVLANDSDADSDPLAITIEEAPLVGNASVNADATISLTGLPPGFKGLTRFKYRATDTSGAWTTATAAVFVGVDPFRVVFAAETQPDGAHEIYLSDFTDEPVALTSSTEGDMRLKGFAVSQNGATIAYRRESLTNAAMMDLTVVRTSAPDQSISVTPPAGATLPLDGGREQFVLSPDGEWLAFIARANGVDTAYALRVSNPSTLFNISPTGAVFASQLRFSQNSQSVYLLASGVAGGAARTLYTTTPGTAPTVPVSAVSNPSASEDVLEYATSPSQGAILLKARRAGTEGLFYVDPRQLQNEIRLNSPLVSDAQILDSTISPPGGHISE